MPKNNKKRPKPLVRPAVLKSRKKARQITSLFHKLTHAQDQARAAGNTEQVQELEERLDAMGGRAEYQRASQLSTSYFSTSKWVLGYLAQLGWLHGIVSVKKQQQHQQQNEQPPKRQQRRPTRLLEIGAINTELVDAAQENQLEVRAIDLHSMHPSKIEEHDFLNLPYRSSQLEERYDVLVCSMVLNCVPNPPDRGKMLCGLYHHLRPGGLLFLTLPKFCLTKSAFLTPQLFEEILGPSGVGFRVEQTKMSPRVAFFICKRPIETSRGKPLDRRWKAAKVLNKGKKFPNQFAVVLKPEEVFGSADEATRGKTPT